MFVYLIVLITIIIFLIAMIYRIVDYTKKPMHVRWELYPVGHESGERATYGGGYLEEVDWWKKPRKTSMFNQVKAMALEIILLKAVWENNRPMWFRSFPFHFGLYLVMGFFGLLVLHAIIALAGGGASGFAIFIAVVAKILGPIGFIMGGLGALGLFLRRLSDQGLRKYSSGEHFFNLILFVATMVLAVITWLVADPNFEITRQFTANMISFNWTPLNSPLIATQIILTFLVIAYIPLTHMSHLFMKYFLYHDIRWGDEPNVDNLEIQKKIGVVLNYPVAWAASHIDGQNKKTWAEVATFNPAAEPEKEKE
jgi:nitrate reductase gamma subunit